MWSQVRIMYAKSYSLCTLLCGPICRPVFVLCMTLKIPCIFTGAGRRPAEHPAGRKYYSVRGKKLEKMIYDIQNNRLFRSTLGGCIVEKVNHTIIISKEG